MNNKNEIWSPEPVFMVEGNSKGRWIKYSDILYIEGDDNYCKIHLINKEVVTVSRTLKSCEEELDINLFFPCHRSYLVNISYIKEYLKKNKKNKVFTIVFYDQSTLVVARRRVSELKRFLRNKLGY